MTTSNKFIKHFRDLQDGESEKPGAAETLAYLNGFVFELIIVMSILYFFLGDLSFQEYEKRVREVNTDYSQVSVGKVLDTREPEIVDIDKLIDELSDIDDLSGLSSVDSSNENSDESSKKQKNDDEPKAKRRRRKKQQDTDEDSDEDDEDKEKILDSNEIRNRMVQHLEQMRLAKQKMKRSIIQISCYFQFHYFFRTNR